MIYRGNGEVEHGVVMLRTEDGRRTLARIPANDETTLAHLRDMDRTPVGSLGEITMAKMACRSGGWASPSPRAGSPSDLRRSGPIHVHCFAQKRRWMRRDKPGHDD